MFVFDVLQILSVCVQICRGCFAATCTTLATGLLKCYMSHCNARSMIMVIKSKSMCMIFCRDFKKLGTSVQETCAVKDGNIWNSDLNIKKHRIRNSCNLYSICLRK